MKKMYLILLSCVLALHAWTAAGENRFYIQNFSIDPGATADVAIMLDNEVTNFASFQADLYMPEGLELVQQYNEEDEEYFTFSLTSRKKSRMAIGSAPQSDGAVRLMLTQTMGSSMQTISGTSGALVTFKVKAADNASGTKYIRLENIIFTTATATQYTLENSQTTVTINENQSVVPATGISLNNATLTLTAAGQTATLTATVTPSNATNKNVTWASSNTAVATVSSTGVVTAVANGTAVITATTADGTNLSAQCTVTVGEEENIEVTDISQMDNVIYINSIEARVGSELTLPIKMKNAAAIRGFQFDLYLPGGVTAVKTKTGKIKAYLTAARLPEDDAHTLTVTEQADGAIRFLCGSQYDETFTGNDGEIATLQLAIAEDMTGGNYPLVLRSIKLTETDISKYYAVDAISTKLTVYNYVTGDINADDIVDVSDYIGVANHIMGDTPEGFNAKAADVNTDQNIDVSDYIGVANIIMTGSVYGQNVASSRSTARRANTDVSSIDNVIYITPLSTTANSQVQLSLKMKNTAQIRGFQFDLYLPNGVTAVTTSNGRIKASLTAARLPEDDEHTLTVTEQSDGAIRFLCGSQYNETFTGNDGEIATLTVNVDADMVVGDYPITMKYVKLTETDISHFYLTEEVLSTLTVTGPADGRIVFDEEDTSLPDYTAGERANVRVKRTIIADEWSTIVLPFDMTEAQVAAAFGDNVQLADFKGYNVTEEGEEVVGITVNFDNVTAIEANHPYIIKVNNAIAEFTVDGVNIAPDDAPCVSFGYETGRPKVYHPMDFIGTYVADFDFYHDALSRALFLSGNTFYYATENTSHMKAFRAYFDFDDVLSEVAGAGARISMNFDEMTGISDNNREAITNNRYYDLQGRRVEKPSKGLYIRNGKKEIVK